MRLQAVRAPDALDVREADPGCLRHRPPGPMRRLAWWLRQRERDDAFSLLWPEWRDARRARLVAQEAIRTFAGEALLPAPDSGLALAGPTHDRVRAKPVSRGQDDRRTPRVLLRAVAVRHHGFKPGAVRGGHVDDDSGAHAPDSHASVSNH